MFVIYWNTDLGYQAALVPEGQGADDIIPSGSAVVDTAQTLEAAHRKIEAAKIRSQPDTR